MVFDITRVVGDRILDPRTRGSPIHNGTSCSCETRSIKRTAQRRDPLFSTTPGDSVTSPGASPTERARRSAARQRLVKEIYIPWNKSSSWWKDNPYKRWRSTPKRGLEFNISKVTNCKGKTCNRVNVKVSIYLLICLVQSLIFAQNFKFVNTFLVSRYLYQIRSVFFRSGDPHIK